MEHKGQCAWCDDDAHIRQGRIMLCAVHYRISSMRARAKRDGKSVPSRDEIESLISYPFVCIGCEREMVWLRRDGASNQATLQHDRSGAIRILCLGCNTRHSNTPDDIFYDIPKESKHCPDCSKILPIEDFAVDKSRPVGRKSYCRSCSSDRFKKWSAKYAA